MSDRGARNEGGARWVGIDGEGGEMGYELVEVTGESDWRNYHTIRRDMGSARKNPLHPPRRVLPA